MIHYREITYGFQFGSAEVDRVSSDNKKGWVVLQIVAPAHAKRFGPLQIYVTKTGRIRVLDKRGEWRQPQ